MHRSRYDKYFHRLFTRSEIFHVVELNSTEQDLPSMIFTETLHRLENKLRKNVLINENCTERRKQIRWNPIEEIRCLDFSAISPGSIDSNFIPYRIALCWEFKILVYRSQKRRSFLDDGFESNSNVGHALIRVHIFSFHSILPTLRGYPDFRCLRAHISRRDREILRDDIDLKRKHNYVGSIVSVNVLQ